MSIWTHYHALAEYITLKYVSELHTVVDTATSIIDRELEIQSLSSARGLATSRRDFSKTLHRTVITVKEAPSVTAYGQSARSCLLSPEICREVLRTHHRPDGIRVIRGPSKRSLFSLKPALHQWQDRLLVDDLSQPELLLALLWEASHGLVDPSRFIRDVFQ